jgi:hypothetical protein
MSAPRQPRTLLRPHPFLPSADGSCWCALPQRNRHHQVEPAEGDRSAAILGERNDDQGGDR